jgi:hypothetical protein
MVLGAVFFNCWIVAAGEHLALNEGHVEVEVGPGRSGRLVVEHGDNGVTGG